MNGGPDLGDAAVLDVGCGTKLAVLLAEEKLPVGRYVGIDASPAVVEFLRSNIADPRQEFHHLDAYNERYHPQGKPLAEMAELPVARGAFDVICLFSVFTHLNPEDYREMLRLLRAHVAEDGILVYSVFINERTAGGHGVVDGWSARTRELEAQGGIRKLLEEGAAPIVRHGDPQQLADLRSHFERYVRETPAQSLQEAIVELETRPGVLARDEAERLAAQLRSWWEEIDATASSSTPDFLDTRPGEPLACALYSRRYAHELIEGTGWKPVALRDPQWHIQHYFVCRPTSDGRG